MQTIIPLWLIRTSTDSVANDGAVDGDCDVNLVCRVSSCDGATCVQPASEAEICSAADFAGCNITQTCAQVLVCTLDGLCD
jgi:hypothetical protein